MGAGVAVILVIVFSTATFMVGLGFGHMLGLKTAEDKQRKELQGMVDAVMTSIDSAQPVVVHTEPPEIIGERGETVN